jgi:hypothetical protein
MPNKAKLLLSYYPLRKYNSIDKVRTMSTAQVLLIAKGSSYSI